MAELVPSGHLGGLWTDGLDEAGAELDAEVFGTEKLLFSRRYRDGFRPTGVRADK
jgi:hypothetical protein